MKRLPAFHPAGCSLGVMFLPLGKCNFNLRYAEQDIGKIQIAPRFLLDACIWFLVFSQV
jgi:hypothetical protein